VARFHLIESRPWAALSTREREHAAALWVMTLAAERYDRVDGMLREVARHEVRDGDDVLAELWLLDDAGLLFSRGAIAGEVVQYGFTCKPAALWEAIEAAEAKPELVDFSLGEDMTAEPVLWRPPASLAAIVLELDRQPRD
jgi:hypothetical protein